ncbi:MAG: 3-deoxy-D-manno-octulosonic acid transferase [Acidobacteria bacterium]|nr:3-deoxy-D-manno-octulosonic acid transferase [Acidobacteriota bacterium]
MFLAYEVILVLVFILASPWFLLIGLMRGKYLPSLRERLGRHAGAPSANDLWVQAVSVGEVIAARTIVRAIQNARPGLSIVVTTTTLTGQTMAKALFPECRIAYFPFDFTLSVNRFLDHYAPRAYVTVETEIWPNVTRLCAARGVPVGLVNGRISDRSFARYRRVRLLLGRVLGHYRSMSVREEADRERLAAMGAPRDRIHVDGNVKFDFDAGDSPLEIAPEIERLARGRKIVVLGSIVEGEEELVVRELPAIAATGAFVVLAPRKPERFDAVGRAIEIAGIPMLRRSTLAFGKGEADLLLLDSIGELARVYRLATLAFVGGSLVTAGGHNPIEPAACGVPVAFGPHMSNFREIAAVFLDSGAAFEVSTPAALTRLIDQLLHDDSTRSEHARRAFAVIDRNRGAATRIATHVLEML